MDEEKQTQGKFYLVAFFHAHVALQHHWHCKGWTLFKLVPKLHYAAHWHDELTTSLKEQKEWALTPGAFSTRILEDFIDVVSRIARTSHPSTVARLNNYKYLVVQIRKAWSASTKENIFIKKKSWELGWVVFGE